MNHHLGPVEQLGHFHARDCRRNHAEIGEGRVPPTDPRHSLVDLPKTIRLGLSLQLRTGIGNGDESPAGPLRANRPPHAVEEVVLENLGLKRAARFARHDEQRLGRIDFRLQRADLRGSVESRTSNWGKPACRPKVIAKTSGQRLDPPMPKRTAWAKPPAWLPPRSPESSRPRPAIFGNAQPVEPRSLVAARP